MSVPPPSDPAIPFACSCACWIKIKYWITEGNDVLSWIHWFGKGVAIFKLSYSYMISVQTVMEKIINDSITLFLYNILKLLCSNFLYIYLIFLYQRQYRIVWWNTFESNCIKIYVRLNLKLFYLSAYLCFYSLVFHVLIKVLLKSHGRFGVLKYNTFCVLVHNYIITIFS